MCEKNLRYYIYKLSSFLKNRKNNIDLLVWEIKIYDIALKIIRSER